MNILKHTWVRIEHYKILNMENIMNTLSEMSSTKYVCVHYGYIKNCS